MCLDFQPDHPNYIAVGFYDGKCPCLGFFAQFRYTLFIVIIHLKNCRLVSDKTIIIERDHGKKTNWLKIVSEFYSTLTEISNWKQNIC